MRRVAGHYVVLAARRGICADPYACSFAALSAKPAGKAMSHAERAVALIAGRRSAVIGMPPRRRDVALPSSTSRSSLHSRRCCLR
jgi:hypothetical protein